MKLVHDFIMERRGYETREARHIKFFARTWYYKKMAEHYKKAGEDPAVGLKIARHLELADHEAKRVGRLCPLNGRFKDKVAHIRHFLLAFDGQSQIWERLRLLKEAINKISENADSFASFSVRGPWLLGFCVEVAKTPPEELPLRHPFVTFETSIEKKAQAGMDATICTDVSVTLTPPVTSPLPYDLAVSRVLKELDDRARARQSHRSPHLESVASGR